MNLIAFSLFVFNDRSDMFLNSLNAVTDALFNELLLVDGDVGNALGDVVDEGRNFADLGEWWFVFGHAFEVGVGAGAENTDEFSAEDLFPLFANGLLNLI